MASPKRPIGKRRGYLVVTIRDRGVTPRGFRRAFNAKSKLAWTETGQYFHDHFRDNRFTPSHAAAAGYAARKGQLQAPGSKAFNRSYYGRKLASPRGGGRGVANPLESSGETREAVASQYRIYATRSYVRISYPGGRKLNFRHPKSRIRMADEFRRLLPSEVETLARVYDQSLDHHLQTQD